MSKSRAVLKQLKSQENIENYFTGSNAANAEKEKSKAKVNAAETMPVKESAAKQRKNNSERRALSVVSTSDPQSDLKTSSSAAELHSLKETKKDEQPESADRSNILDWLTKQEISDVCWKELAEQRRLALEEALTENEELHEKIKSLELENAELKTCNEALQDMADEAHRLASILEELTAGLDE